MHELSLAENIVDIVRQNLPAEQSGAVSVKVRVGEMAGVVPDSLAFCFEAITAGTPLEGMRMVIERVPLREKCRTCGEERVLPQPLFLCPACGGSDLLILSGRELEVSEIEVEDP